MDNPAVAGILDIPGNPDIQVVVVAADNHRGIVVVEALAGKVGS